MLDYEVLKALKMNPPPPKKWSEHDHAKRLAKWVRDNRAAFGGVMLVKVTNEGKRSMADAARTHAEGTVKGFPDYLVILRDRIFFIELKSETGRVRPEQKEVHEEINALGHKVYVCKGWMPARDVIIAEHKGLL